MRVTGVQQLNTSFKEQALVLNYSGGFGAGPRFGHLPLYPPCFLPPQLQKYYFRSFVYYHCLPRYKRPAICNYLIALWLLSGHLSDLLCLLYYMFPVYNL